MMACRFAGLRAGVVGNLHDEGVTEEVTTPIHPPWTLLPINLVLNIFSYLSYQDIVNAGATCRKWWPASRDELLWKQIFYQHWKIDRQSQLAPGFRSWRREFIRLCQWHTNAPCVKAQELKKHTDEALHVSFSHNGAMLSTCSKDGTIIVWNSGHPVTLKHSADMKKYTWKYTQYSQFNNSDTLLLVSGVHFGYQSTSGEIAVFNLDDFALQVRVLNKPYDTFGTWLTNMYLLSGQQCYLGNLSTCSALWLNKANQEIESENEVVVMLMYRFLNVMAASIRMLMVADCPLICLMDSQYTGQELDINDIPESVQMGISPHSIGPWVYEDASSAVDFSDSEFESSNRAEDGEVLTSDDIDGPSSSDPHRSEEWVSDCHNIKDPSPCSSSQSSVHNAPPHHPWGSNEEVSSTTDGAVSSVSLSGETIDSAGEGSSEASNGPTDFQERRKHKRSSNLCSEVKYLIFTTGSTTYTPHQIGIKRIDPDRTNIAASTLPSSTDLQFNGNYENTDYVIDLEGHINGMKLSPDNRYLFVNLRTWPSNCIIPDPMDPPPIAREIEMRVIDLVTRKQVGRPYVGHTAHTANDSCFFIFPDVCKNYVASGAEDRHAYLWDRHYRTLIAKLKHHDVVNAVAFNPTDSEMMVTVSDDHIIRVWRSARQLRELDPKKLQKKSNSPS